MDASLNNLPNGKSQSGLLIFLQDDSGNKCPILWKSKRLQRVVTSTLAAETQALVYGAETLVYLAALLKQLKMLDEIEIFCYTDNKSIVDALTSTKQIANCRLRLEVNALNDMIERKEISKVIWVKSNEQLADCLTKRGVSTDGLKQIISRD